MNYEIFKAEITALDNHINSTGINQTYNLQSVRGTALHNSFKIDNEFIYYSKRFQI